MTEVEARKLNRMFTTADNLGQTNTDHAGLEISVNSRIASPFSRQIAFGNAGPVSALEFMEAKLTFRCHFLNIGPSYKQ